jgi:hypothetical protein
MGVGLQSPLMGTHQAAYRWRQLYVCAVRIWPCGRRSAALLTLPPALLSACHACRLMPSDDEGEQPPKALPPDSDVRLHGHRGKGPSRAVGAAAGAVGAKVAGSVWRMALGRVARALGAF